MIRKATIKDFDAVERMLHDFHSDKASQFSAELYDRLHFRNVFRSLISGSGKGFACVLEVDGAAVGCLLAGASPSPFAPILVADEVLWWVEPEHRSGDSLKMLDLYEGWAEGIGAKIVGLSFFGGKVPAEYKRRGYAPGERKFAKAL